MTRKAPKRKRKIVSRRMILVKLGRIAGARHLAFENLQMQKSLALWCDKTLEACISDLIPRVDTKISTRIYVPVDLKNEKNVILHAYGDGHNSLEFMHQIHTECKKRRAK